MRPSGEMPPGVAYGSSTLATCGTAASFGEQRRDVGLDGRRRSTGPVGADDHVDGVTRLGRELVLEQLWAALESEPGAE